MFLYVPKATALFDFLCLTTFKDFFVLDKHYEKELIAGAFIIGAFFGIFILNLLGYNSENCFIG